MSGSVTGILLCGGSARRFDGQDKPLVPLAGKLLVEHVLGRLETQVDRLVISANRNLDQYARYGHPVVADEKADRGPLAGLAAALPVTDSELLFVCPGDAPLLASDLVGNLSAALVDGVDAVLPHDGERAQHLFLLLRRQAALGVPGYLDQGGRSVVGYLETLKTAVAPMTDALPFTNVNTPEDLMLLQALLEQDWRYGRE